MKKKTLYKLGIGLVGPLLTLVVFSFWHYTDNTKDEFLRLDTKIETKVGEVRQEIVEVRKELSQELREIRNLLIAELRGKSQSQPTNG